MNQDLLIQKYNYACHQADIGNHKGAIETVRQVLAEMPEFAPGHALLSLCLLDDKRVTAAEHEIRLALSIAPEDAFNHYVHGRLQLVRQQRSRALESLRHAIALDPAFAAPHLALVDMYLDERRYPEAERALQEALAIEPDSLLVRTMQARVALARGDLGAALTLVDEVLREEPQDVPALCLKGHILLRGGDLDDARQHAIWALQVNPMDESALQLLVSLKARRNWFLGLWWRYAVAVASKPLQWQLLILVGMYVVYRLSVLVLTDMGQAGAASSVQVLWLGFVVYTWLSPMIFNRMMNRELRAVGLSADY